MLSPLLALLVLLSAASRVGGEETAAANETSAIPTAHAEPAVSKDEAERIVLWKRMIEAGADINRLGKYDESPLHWAAQK